MSFFVAADCPGTRGEKDRDEAQPDKFGDPLQHPPSSFENCSAVAHSVSAATDSDICIRVHCFHHLRLSVPCSPVVLGVPGIHVHEQAQKKTVTVL